MCGFIVAISDQPFSGDRLSKAETHLLHRGPDYTGSYSCRLKDGRYVNALHTRLTIVDDFSRSNQPLVSDSYVFIFNGELYNYRDLGSRLVSEGVNVNTASDTDVFAKLISFYGVNKALRLADGMWSFVYVDRNTSDIFISRDRFGEKPLYVYRSSEKITYYSSSINSISACAGRKLRLNSNQALRFLFCGYKSLYKSNTTFFEDVSVLPSSSLIKSSSNLDTHTYYWSSSDSYLNRDNFNLSRHEILDHIRFLFRKKILTKLVSEVPTAFCLSSGVDSNVLASLYSTYTTSTVNSYSLISSDSRYDESSEISNILACMPYNSTFVDVGKADYLNLLLSLSGSRSSPVVTISYLIQAQLYQAMSKSGIRVSISGTGADELFTGYYDHHLFYLNYLKDSSSSSFNHALDNWKRHTSAYVRNPYLRNPQLIIDDPTLRDHIYLDCDKFINHFSSEMRFSPLFAEQNYSSIPLHNRMDNELFHETVPPIVNAFS